VSWERNDITYQNQHKGLMKNPVKIGLGVDFESFFLAISFDKTRVELKWKGI
jgi:hypothetical protein